MANNPTLTLPSSEHVTADGTVAVTGASYTDSFAQNNPGAMYINISDSSGDLWAYYPGAGGATTDVSGDGSNSITFQGSYADVQDIINSLTYVATTASGSDSIAYDVWNQAGTQTTGNVPVTIGGTSGVTETWTGAVSSDWNTAGNWSGNTVPTSGDTVMIYGNTPNNATLSNATLTGETVILQGSGNSSPVVDFNNVTLNSLLESGNVGQVQIGGTLTIGAQGTVLAEGNAGLSLSGTAETIVNNGLLSSAPGGYVDIYNNPLNSTNNATLVNRGSIVADGGKLALANSGNYPSEPPQWDLDNSGSISLTGGGALQLDGTVSGGDIAFDGTGSLTLEQPDALANGATLSGFGQGDEIALIGSAWGTLTAFNNGTLEVGPGGSLEAIPMAGSYSFGNFENGVTATGQNPSNIVYAPSNGTSGLVSPEIVAPADATVAQGATLVLNDISITAQGGGTITSGGSFDATIGVDTGTLYLNGVSGSGSNQLQIGPVSAAQLNADLANLSYVPGAGASSDTMLVDVQPQNSYVPISTLRYVPIAVTAGSSGPTLNEPSSETTAPDSSVPVKGSYSDSFAAGNPGSMYLSISDNSGSLSAYYANGTPNNVTVTGSPGNPLVFQGSYADVEDILQTLTYTAGTSPGSDTVSFDIWNQAGTQTTGSVPVTITGAGNGTSETWTGAVSSDWNTAGNWSYGAVPTSGDTAVIPGNTSNNAALSNAVLTGETITLGTSAGNPTVDFTGVTLGAGSLLNGAGQIDVGGTFTVASGATLAPTGEVNVMRSSQSSPTMLVNDGTIVTSASGNFISLGDDVVNNGTVIDTAGHIGTGGTFVNNGAVLDNGGGFEVDGTIVGGTIDVSGGGELQLTASMAMADGATVAGFGQGSELAVFQPINGLSFSDNTLDIFVGSTLTEAVPFTSGLGLGNFEIVHSIDVPYSTDSTVAYAASGEGSTALAGGDAPNISAPATGTINAGGTLSLGDVSISNGGTMTLSITAGTGTLYMNGASGNGTNHLTIGAETSQSQINSDLSSLSYVAAAGSANASDTVEITADAVASPTGTIDTSRYIPISVAGNSSGPALNEPSSETVAPSGTIAVSGSYSDSFAQSNPGQLYVDISDSSGTLSATNASGQAVAGSGTNHIGLSADYVDVNAILSSLHYTAGSTAGSDTISFEVWNQAGTDTNGSTAVTIDPPTQGSNMTMADFVAPSGTSSGGMLPGSSNGSSGSMMPTDSPNHPIGIPLTIPG